MTNKQYRFLKVFYRKPKAVALVYKKCRIDEDIFYDLSSDIQDLFYVKSSDTSSCKERIFHITHEGERKVEERMRWYMRWGIPMVISIIALLSSWRQELLSALAELLRLLRQ